MSFQQAGCRRSPWTPAARFFGAGSRRFWPRLHVGSDTIDADTHRRFLRGCIFGPGCKSRRLHRSTRRARARLAHGRPCPPKRHTALVRAASRARHVEWCPERGPKGRVEGQTERPTYTPIRLAAPARGSLMAGRVHRSATWLGWQAVSAEAPHGPGVSRVARVASNGAWLTTFTSLGVRTTRYTSDARLIWSGESPDTTRVAEGHTPHVVSQSSFSTPKSTELSQRL
jgi:hypothetical protein